MKIPFQFLSKQAFFFAGAADIGVSLLRNTLVLEGHEQCSDRQQFRHVCEFYDVVMFLHEWSDEIQVFASFQKPEVSSKLPISCFPHRRHSRRDRDG